MPVHPPFPVALHDSERKVAFGGELLRCPAPIALDAALSTKLCKIKNLHSTDTIGTENSGTRGRSIWIQPGKVRRIDGYAAGPNHRFEPPARQGWRLNHFIGGGHATPHQRARGQCAPIVAAASCEDKAGRTGFTAFSPNP